MRTHVKVLWLERRKANGSYHFHTQFLWFCRCLEFSQFAQFHKLVCRAHPLPARHRKTTSCVACRGMPTLIHSQPVVNISPKRFEGHHLLSLHPKKVVLDTGLTTPLQLLLCCKLQKIVDDISQTPGIYKLSTNLPRFFWCLERDSKPLLFKCLGRKGRRKPWPFVGSGCTIVPSNNHLGQWWTTTESRGKPWFLAATKSFPAKKQKPLAPSRYVWSCSGKTPKGLMVVW